VSCVVRVACEGGQCGKARWCQFFPVEPQSRFSAQRQLCPRDIDERSVARTCQVTGATVTGVFRSHNPKARITMHPLCWLKVILGISVFALRLGWFRPSVGAEHFSPTHPHPGVQASSRLSTVRGWLKLHPKPFRKLFCFGCFGVIAVLEQGAQIASERV
jgi:hypothetical protein